LKKNREGEFSFFFFLARSRSLPNVLAVVVGFAPNGDCPPPKVNAIKSKKGKDSNLIK
jgi:hypothetical protein